jgi:hypothetical protein
MAWLVGRSEGENGMKRRSANATHTDANREFRDRGGRGTLQAFMLALIAFALLDWFVR